MTEIRCVKCGRLLLKANYIEGEVKCPKCHYINKMGIVKQDQNLCFVVK